MTNPKEPTQSRPRSPRAPKSVQPAAKVAAPVYEDEVEDQDPYSEEYTEIDPRDVAKYKDKIIYVRNNTASTVVWDASTDGSPGTSRLRLTQAGTAESVSQLPYEVASHRSFLRWWRQGKVTVTDDPTMEERLEAIAQADVELDRLEQISIEHKFDRQHNQTIAWPGIPVPASNGPRSL